MSRIVIFGNSGSGKSTLAAALAREASLEHLDLDTLAWDKASPTQRRSLIESRNELSCFMQAHNEWVIEGCYSDLLSLAISRCDKLIFLNPGIEACIRNCRSRPWEPHKYPRVEAQNQNLEMLIRWVREYETRDDEFSLQRHRHCSQNSMARKLSTQIMLKCPIRPCTRRAKTHAGDGGR